MVKQFTVNEWIIGSIPMMGEHIPLCGRMAEWFKAVDCKSIYLIINIGSNPISSNKRSFRLVIRTLLFQSKNVGLNPTRNKGFGV
jgi:hypothetical protein